MTNPKSSRTRLKVVLFVVVLLAVVGWFIARPAYQRHGAIQEIERVGGVVHKETVGPQWLSQWGFRFGRVTFVDLGGTEISDDGLKHLSRLQSLNSLSLNFTGVSDDGLKHVSSLPNLELLQLNETAISNEGLEHLSSLTNLKWLMAFPPLIDPQRVRES
jgi:hypothetical protein